jgi:predicted acetyltransferase
MSLYTAGMDYEIRPIGLDRWDEAVRLHGAAFSEEIHPEEADVVRPIFVSDRNLAAFEGDTMVGQASASPMELTVPGGLLPAAGITAVAVLPTHRRRGVGRALMRRQLDEVHDQGTSLAYLWASEGRIYQRFGYGIGSFSGAFDIHRTDTEMVHTVEPPGRMRLFDRAEAMKSFPSVYERVRPGRPGMIDRDERWWNAVFLDIEARRDGATPFFWAAYEGRGGLDGYVVYRVKEAHDHRGRFRNVLDVEELVWASPDAYVGLWTYCFGVDLIGRLTGWRRPVDEPLLYLLAEPRALSFRFRDGTWLRVVDVPAALEARRYAVEDRVTLGVEDAFCPWNEAAWTVEGGPDGATCRRADSDPDLILDAATLSSSYLGTVSFRSMADAGRVAERTEGAVARADAMFASTPAPWCPHIF